MEFDTEGVEGSFKKTNRLKKSNLFDDDVDVKDFSYLLDEPTVEAPVYNESDALAALKLDTARQNQVASSVPDSSSALVVAPERNTAVKGGGDKGIAILVMLQAINWATLCFDKELTRRQGENAWGWNTIQHGDQKVSIGAYKTKLYECLKHLLEGLGEDLGTYQSKHPNIHTLCSNSWATQIDKRLFAALVDAAHQICDVENDSEKLTKNDADCSLGLFKALTQSTSLGSTSKALLVMLADTLKVAPVSLAGLVQAAQRHADVFFPAPVRSSVAGQSSAKSVVPVAAKQVTGKVPHSALYIPGNDL